MGDLLPLSNVPDTWAVGATGIPLKGGEVNAHNAEAKLAGKELSISRV